MSAGGPRGRTTRRSLARLHADALLLRGSEEGATAGRTPDSAKVAAVTQPSINRLGHGYPGRSHVHPGPTEMSSATTVFCHTTIDFTVINASFEPCSP